MMGPDCGTAIINNVPLAFANVIRPGDIGIVGASGTGTQELSSLIGQFGGRRLARSSAPAAATSRSRSAVS